MSVFSKSGHLEDFRHRQGDERSGSPGVAPGAAQKWGARTLLSNFQSLNQPAVGTGERNPKPTVKRATFVRTQDLGVPMPLNLQVRFAVNDQGNVRRGNPILPFEYPLVGSATRIKVTIRRGIDPSSSPTIDDYFIGVNEVLPIDTITARELGVEIEAVGPAAIPNDPDSTTAWVEAICSPVQDIGPTNKIHPWAVADNPAFKATSATASALLAANTQRVQFFIQNTSTNADLLLQFGLGPNNDVPVFGATPKGSFILPRNIFAVYESPCPCGFKGTVFGIWSNAGDGGAIVHQGLVF